METATELIHAREGEAARLRRDSSSAAVRASRLPVHNRVRFADGVHAFSRERREEVRLLSS